MSFKVSDEEARPIRAGARSEGISVSEHLRRRARLAVPPLSPPRLVRDPHTGAMIFVALEDLPPPHDGSGARAALRLSLKFLLDVNILFAWGWSARRPGRPADSRTGGVRRHTPWTPTCRSWRRRARGRLSGGSPRFTGMKACSTICIRTTELTRQACATPHKPLAHAQGPLNQPPSRPPCLDGARRDSGCSVLHWRRTTVR